MKSNVLQLSHRIKTFIEASCTNNIHIGEYHLWSYHFYRFMGHFFSDKAEKRDLDFDLFESFFAFLEVRRLEKCCLWEVYLVFYMQMFHLIWQSVNLLWKQQFKMLVAFSPIFVADKKVTFRGIGCKLPPRGCARGSSEILTKPTTGSSICTFWMPSFSFWVFAAVGFTQKKQPRFFWIRTHSERFLGGGGSGGFG